MFLNIRPKQLKKIPWGWTNVQGAGNMPIVSRHPGVIHMPDLVSYFDWNSWEITPPSNEIIMEYGIPLSLGTRDMKSVFTTMIRFLGWEKAYDDLTSSAPSISRITDGFIKWNEKLLDQFGGSLSWFMIGDDYADNKGMMISPELWSDTIRPEIKRLVNLAKYAGCRVIMHTDGDISSILDSLIDLEIDMLNFQPVGGMELFANRKYYRSIPMWKNSPSMDYEGYNPEAAA